MEAVNISVMSSIIRRKPLLHNMQNQIVLTLRSRWVAWWGRVCVLHCFKWKGSHDIVYELLPHCDTWMDQDPTPEIVYQREALKSWRNRHSAISPQQRQQLENGWRLSVLDVELTSERASQLRLDCRLRACTRTHAIEWFSCEVLAKHDWPDTSIKEHAMTRTTLEDKCFTEGMTEVRETSAKCILVTGSLQECLRGCGV